MLSISLHFDHSHGTQAKLAIAPGMKQPVMSVSGNQIDHGLVISGVHYLSRNFPVNCSQHHASL